MRAPDHVVLNRSAEPGAGAIRLFGEDCFATPWRRLEYIELPSGAPFCSEGAGEERALVVLQGGIEVEGIGDLDANRVLLCGEFAAVNRDDQPVCLLHAVVAIGAEARPRTAIVTETVDAKKLGWRPALHGGAGRIATRHIWGPEDFSSTFTFLDHAILESGASVGYHYHQALEESFFVLRGRGLMTIDDNTFEVGPDSVTRQGIGQGHGIFNPHGEHLEFLRIAVARAEEAYSTVDLHDDLTGRSVEHEPAAGES